METVWKLLPAGLRGFSGTDRTEHLDIIIIVSFSSKLQLFLFHLKAVCVPVCLAIACEPWGVWARFQSWPAWLLQPYMKWTHTHVPACVHSIPAACLSCMAMICKYYCCKCTNNGCLRMCTPEEHLAGEIWHWIATCIITAMIKNFQLLSKSVTMRLSVCILILLLFSH